MTQIKMSSWRHRFPPLSTFDSTTRTRAAQLQQSIDDEKIARMMHDDTVASRRRYCAQVEADARLARTLCDDAVDDADEKSDGESDDNPPQYVPPLSPDQVDRQLIEDVLNDSAMSAQTKYEMLSLLQYVRAQDDERPPRPPPLPVLSRRTLEMARLAAECAKACNGVIPTEVADAVQAQLEADTL